MKHYHLFFLFLFVLFYSCSNSQNITNANYDEDNIATINNATDDLFYYDIETGWNPEFDYKGITKPRYESTGFKDGFVRNSNTTGIIGKWVNYNSKKNLLTGENEQFTTTFVFSDNGSYTYISKFDNKTIRYKGIYELYKSDNNIFNIIIYYGEIEYDMMYFCSDSCLVFEDAYAF